MYLLENGRLTWFRPEIDVFLWGGCDLGLGELTDHVRNMVIPLTMVLDYDKAVETFDWLFDQIRFDQLENVHIEMSGNFTMMSKRWHPAIKKKLFNANTVVIPNLFYSEDEVSEDVDDICSILPDGVSTYWKECRAISFTHANSWVDHIAGDVTYAWITTQAERIKEIGKGKVKAVESETLMHPSGISWWDYLANSAPAFTPTCVFTRLTDRERVQELY
ncbi:hypothetical protein GGR53DRAFT_529648 [Hypoxylon sp. FL1150]|nr:hypothetical protein GGR53DRAFT_529648 [Hypoxylon sp. FL1150]